MTSVNILLTKDDFINSRWQEVINSSERKDCRQYSEGFYKKAKEAKETGNIREQTVFELMAAVTDEQFFAEVFQNLTDEHLDFLVAIAPEVSDAELQARIADILWSRRRDHKMAQLAVNAYLQSALELEDHSKWTLCFTRIERAYRLAHKIKYQVEAVISHIETVLARCNGEDPLLLSANLMELLQENKLGNPKKYANLAEKAANKAESNQNWQIAKAYWEIKAKWHSIEKESEKERIARIQAAQTYVKEAEEIVKKTHPSYIRASIFMQKAVEAFRKISGTKKEIAESHKLLIQYQEESKKELITVTHEFDISDLVEEAKTSVKGKKFQDALFSLLLLVTPTKVSYLREEAEKKARDFPLSELFPEVMINEMGKTVARRTTSILSENPDEAAEKATLFEMNQQAILYQISYAQAFIEPARSQINLEHSVQIKDLLAIISDSPFVPAGRENLFAKGLYTGLIGDFITSTHILIPQIENSVRYLLRKKGVITSGLDDRGIQNEHNLNTTLYCPEIISLFDEDTLFNLKGLLVEHSGSNLRNRMAHGLINDNEFHNNTLMSYLWWLTLRLCCLPILDQHKIEHSDPWVKFAGMFKDDPFFDEFTEDIASYRRELDGEIDILGEN